MNDDDWRTTICAMVIFVGFAWGYDRDPWAPPHHARGLGALWLCVAWLSAFWWSGGGSWQ